MRIKFGSKVNISNFSVENIDISDIEDIISKLPRNGIVDLNIAEMGLIYTLEGQNICQEKITQLDRWVGHLETLKNKAWSSAALIKAKEKGYKTVKDKEWFAASDDAYIQVHNDITLAKAARKWLENKVSYFSGWHYAFKSFLRRDYLIENSANLTVRAYNIGEGGGAGFPPQKVEKVEVNENDIDWG